MLSDCKELLQYVKPECLEAKYGGTMPEIGSKGKTSAGLGAYFPPNMEIPGEHLLSQRELHERCPLHFKNRPEEVQYFMPMTEINAPTTLMH